MVRYGTQMSNLRSLPEVRQMQHLRQLPNLAMFITGTVETGENMARLSWFMSSQFSTIYNLSPSPLISEICSELTWVCLHLVAPPDPLTEKVLVRTERSTDWAIFGCI